MSHGLEIPSFPDVGNTEGRDSMEAAGLVACTPIGPATPNFRAAQPSNTSSSTAISQIPATHHMPSASKNNCNPESPPSNVLHVRSQGCQGVPFTAHQHATTPPNKFPIVRRFATTQALLNGSKRLVR